MFLILLLKGFVIGLAFIIPGVSGGTLAVYLGVYDKLLHSIGHIFKEFKKSISFLFPIFFGIGISVVALAWIFSLLLNLNSFIVLFFFIGLMLGGIKPIYQIVNKEKITSTSILAFLLAFIIIIVLIIFEKNGNNNFLSTIPITFKYIIIVFLVGMASSITMIVPGVSGSALLMVLGFYTAIVSNVVGQIFVLSNIIYNLEILIPFGLGALAGIILFSRIIEYSLENYKAQTYFAILGFIIASCIAIFFEIKDQNSALIFDLQTPMYLNIIDYIKNNILTILLGLVSISLGFITSRMLVKIEVTNE